MSAISCFRVLSVSIMLSIFFPAAWAQATGQTGSTGSTGTTRGDTTRPPIGRPPQEIFRPSRPNNRAIYISGTVVLEDGAPLPQNVVIERICGGRTRKEAYVDTRGGFSFEVGGNNYNASLIPEASDDEMTAPGPFSNRSTNSMSMPGGPLSMSSSNLLGCELRAQLAGYRSSVIMLDGFNSGGQIDVGNIVLQRMEKVVGATVSASEMRAPKAAKKSLERARAAAKKKNPDQAEKHLKTALDIYPEYATAWFELGQLNMAKKREAEAVVNYEKAIAADARFVPPYLQLARLAGMRKDWQKVAEITDLALALDPLDFPEAYLFSSLAYYSLKKFEPAEISARKAIRLDSIHRFPRAHLILADILQQRKDLAGSIEQLKAFLKLTPTGADADLVRSRIGELESFSAELAKLQPPD